MFLIINTHFKEQNSQQPGPCTLPLPPTGWGLQRGEKPSQFYPGQRRAAVLAVSVQCPQVYDGQQQPATAIKHSHWSTPSPHLPSHWLAPASAGNSLEALINNFVTTFMNKRLDFRLRQNYTGLRIMSRLESWFTAMSETQNRARGGGRLESLHKIIKSQNLVNFKLTFAQFAFYSFPSFSRARDVMRGVSGPQGFIGGHLGHFYWSSDSFVDTNSLTFRYLDIAYSHRIEFIRTIEFS